MLKFPETVEGPPLMVVASEELAFRKSKKVAVTAYWSLGSVMRSFVDGEVMGRLMWPEIQSANPPAEVENVGFENPVVLLKGLFAGSAHGLASELTMKRAWIAETVERDGNISVLYCFAGCLWR